MPLWRADVWLQDEGGGRVYGRALLLKSCFDDVEGLKEDARDKAAQAARNQILSRHCFDRQPSLRQHRYYC